MTSLTRKLGLVAGLILATLGVASAQEMKPIRSDSRAEKSTSCFPTRSALACSRRTAST